MSSNLTLEEARKTLLEQEELLKQLTTPPFSHARVLNVGKEFITIISNSKVTDVERPSFKLNVGDAVHTNMTGNIVDKIKDEFIHGNLATVEKQFQNYVELTINGEKKVLQKKNIEVENGDTLLITENLFIQKNFGKPNIMKSTETVQVPWEDIGGLEIQKKQIRDLIETPYEFKQLFEYYGKKHAKGILLYGPPGNGKTMIGKAASTSLAKINGAQASTGFIYVKGPELLDPYVGVTEAKIRNLFKTAREHYLKNHYPAIIFIDEADSVLGQRDSDRHYQVTAVSTFLAETDGFDATGAMLFLTTNRPDSIDPAVLREGRIDRKIRIPRPDKLGCRQIFKTHLKNKRLDKDVCAEILADRFVELLFEQERINKMLSGAFVTEIVESSATVAMNRDILDNTKTGIRITDVEIALQLCHHQNLELLTE